MQLDISTLRWILGGLFAAIASLLVATLRAGREKRDYEHRNEQHEIMWQWLFGDPKQGKLGNSYKISLYHDAQDRLRLQFKAFLKGVNVVGSGEHDIQEGVRKSMAEEADEAAKRYAESEALRAEAQRNRDRLIQQQNDWFDQAERTDPGSRASRSPPDPPADQTGGTRRRGGRGGGGSGPVGG